MTGPDADLGTALEEVVVLEDKESREDGASALLVEEA